MINYESLFLNYTL